MAKQPELVADAAAIVGEGPLWATNQTLLWVDILGRRINRFDPQTGLNSVEFQHGHENVAFVLEDYSGKLLIGLNRTVHLLSAEGLSEPLVRIVDADELRSLNDATIDPAGNLWVGVYENGRSSGDGSLWRVAPDGHAVAVVDGLTLPNGVGFSPSGTHMYLVDSFDHAINEFAIDVSTGRLSDRRLLWHDDSKGLPDGLAVDVEGNLWVAFWGGSCVRAFTPEGREIERVDFPVTQVASCAFAPNGLLYVTSARAFLEDDDLAAQPLAGGLFRVDVGIDGLPINRFGQS
jgi:sugar lactone lactonase YvrE